MIELPPPGVDRSAVLVVLGLAGAGAGTVLALAVDGALPLVRRRGRHARRPRLLEGWLRLEHPAAPPPRVRRPAGVGLRQPSLVDVAGRDLGHAPRTAAELLGEEILEDMHRALVARLQVDAWHRIGMSLVDPVAPFRICTGA